MTEKTLQSSAVQALGLALAHKPIEPAQQVAGAAAATTGYQDLGQLGTAEVRVWEMSVGAMQDVEADEYFVVLAGAGQLHIQQSAGFSAQAFELVPGSVVRLHAGMRTRWSVTETLRKLYFTR